MPAPGMGGCGPGVVQSLAGSQVVMGVVIQRFGDVLCGAGMKLQPDAWLTLPQRGECGGMAVEVTPERPATLDVDGGLEPAAGGGRQAPLPGMDPAGSGGVLVPLGQRFGELVDPAAVSGGGMAAVQDLVA